MNLRRHLPQDTDSLIDLAPLIDVVFLLLIFFAVSTTFSRESELEVNLPQANASAADPKPETIVISIDAHGRYAIDGKVLINDQADTVLRALQREISRYQRPGLLINADANTPHRAVVTVMDAARQLNLNRIGLATRTQDSSPP